MILESKKLLRRNEKILKRAIKMNKKNRFPFSFITL